MSERHLFACVIFVCDSITWLIVFSQRDEVYTGGVKRGHEVAFDCDLGGRFSDWPFIVLLTQRLTDFYSKEIPAKKWQSPGTVLFIATGKGAQPFCVPRCHHWHSVYPLACSATQNKLPQEFFKSLGSLVVPWSNSLAQRHCLQHYVMLIDQQVGPGWAPVISAKCCLTNAWSVEFVSWFCSSKSLSKERLPNLLPVCLPWIITSW